MKVTGNVHRSVRQRVVGPIGVGLVGVGLLSACSGGSAPRPAPTATPTGSPVATTSTAPAPAAVVAPLTGRTPVARRPVIVVKIENSPEARPQSGLGAADIVVEELVEGGLTRFAAMFQSSDPGSVGPVRSVRNVDAQIAGPTHGVLAFSGGAAPALAAVSRTDLHLVQEGDRSGAYHRIRTRPAPHNLYLQVADLWSTRPAAAPGPYLPFAPAVAPAPGGSGTASAASGQGRPSGSPTPASSVRLAFSAGERPAWTFDPRSRQWQRSETGGRAATDARGARLVADNVLVLRVRIGDAGYVDPIGNPVPETLFTGTGSATLLGSGWQASGTWSKGDAGAPLQLKGVGGQPLAVPPGRTWIELVPVQGSVQVR